MSHIDLSRLIRTLEPNLRVGLETAASLAARHQQPVVEVSHWLRAILDIPEVSAVFEDLRVPSETLRTELDAAIADIRREDDASLVLSQNLLSLAREAWLVASLQFGRSTITLPDLLAALTADHALRSVVRGIAPSMRSLDRTRLDDSLEKAKADQTDNPSEPALSRPAFSSAENEFLRLYTRDMTADARAGKIDPVIGRDRELRQLIDILMRGGRTIRSWWARPASARRRSPKRSPWRLPLNACLSG
jgi:type VI secretion system protein VasG